VSSKGGASGAFLQDIAHYPVPDAPPSRPVPPDKVPPGCPLPTWEVAAVGPDGDVWVGGEHGAARYSKGMWRCFWGRRWLPANHVTELRFDGLDAWLRTDAGWSRIERRPMTLEQKAEHYQRLTEERHTLGGFVARCKLSPGGEPSHFYRSVDNDGLWTGLYVAAQCFRFASTADAEATRRADESMAALLSLEQATGIPGFPARSLVRRGAANVLWNEGEWFESETIPGSWWKGDTSSDELSGHFFAYHVYWSLMPDGRHRERVAATCGRILDHLLGNDYRLIGPGGLPTRWANFRPSSLNDDPEWDHERGLNSLCILAFLAVGHLLTGNPAYDQAMQRLIEQHGYMRNAITQKMLAPYEVNHSDDQLAFLAYYSLARLIPSGDNRELLLDSLRRSIEIERPERCSLFNLIAAAIEPDENLVADARSTLEEWPWDLRDWECRNSFRTDVEIDPTPDRFGRRQLTTVLPPSERPVYRWNTNPYVADGGGDGTMEEDGAAWLLAFWLGRHHGLL